MSCHVSQAGVEDVVGLQYHIPAGQLSRKIELEKLGEPKQRNVQNPEVEVDHHEVWEYKKCNFDTKVVKIVKVWRAFWLTA